MLPPEIQRIVLLVALAATGYLMILAWTEDMEKAKEPISYEETPIATDDNSAAVGADVPAIAQETAASSDVPDASLIAGEAQEEPAAVAQTTGNASRLIEVSTPSLRIWIRLYLVSLHFQQAPGLMQHSDLARKLPDTSRQKFFLTSSFLSEVVRTALIWLR